MHFAKLVPGNEIPQSSQQITNGCYHVEHKRLDSLPVRQAARPRTFTAMSVRAATEPYTAMDVLLLVSALP